jgi:NosR/NirI family nitrous oxide reductase transcriptional regulator
MEGSTAAGLRFIRFIQAAFLALLLCASGAGIALAQRLPDFLAATPIG